MLTDLDLIERNIRELARLRAERQSLDDRIAALSLENDERWARIRAAHAQNSAQLQQLAQGAGS